MTPEQIGQAYDGITHLWQSQDFNRENGMAEHRRALAFVEGRGAALDVGCGCTGRFIDWLVGEGFSPEGVDVSAKMIELAQQRNPEIRFYHQDIFQWQLPQSYDFITAWDSIWHLQLDKQKPLLSKLVNALNPGGVLIFSCGSTDEAGEHTDDFMGPTVLYSSLGVNGFWQLFSQLPCRICHFEAGPKPDLHSYFIVQKI